jgi:UDP-N-acetylmuramoyl-tripeptide--D-alanyl-D-alanine ligase
VPPGRGEIIQHNDITIIDDSYNANLASVKAGIDFLISTDGKRKIAVLGDMLELGDLAITEHIKLGKYASEKKLDALFATGELTKSAITEAEHSIPAYFYKSKTELIESLKSYLQPGDVVYVKGSRGMKMEEVIQEGLCK